jgi:peroxiredoxin
MNLPTSPRPKQEIGGIMPDMALPLVSGGTADLQMFLDGKKGAVVLFWSETCSHCLRYDVYLNEFTDRHPDLGLVAVASRHGETTGQIEAAIANRGLRFPILRDVDGSVARQWFTQQTPRVFLMDSSRLLLYRGAIDNYRYPEDPDYRPYLEPAIQSFLAKQLIERPETASFGCAIESVYYILPKSLS